MCISDYWNDGDPDMKNLFILVTSTLALLTLSFAFAESAAPSDQWPGGVTPGARPTVAKWLEDRPAAGTCNPTDNVSVERFFAPPLTGTDSGTVNIEVLVNSKEYGTETLSILQPDTADAARIEILRFQPRERLRLLELAAEGAFVEIQSDDLDGGALPLNKLVELRVDSPDATSFNSEATITRSTWRKGKSNRSDENGLRNIFADQTYQECVNECQWVEEDCISYYNCHWSDDQCFWQCEQLEIQCENDCPCTGVDPILVNQYATPERIIVSGPHGITCRLNALGPGNVLYDVYTVFTRTRSYRVWEDCHGVQTTELVSTHDSGNHACYAISQQSCSPSVGPAPCVLF